MLATDSPPELRAQFTFADHLVLDESPTRDFYVELIRGLTHKHNNLLAVVQGFSSLVLMNDLDESTRESVEQMRHSAQSSSALGERILSTGGCSRINPQSLHLADFLPHMESGLRQLCEQCGVTFYMSIAPSAQPIVADSSRLKEIITALVKNAAEAAATAESEGNVSLEILAPGDMTPISENRLDILVRNNGEEIPESRLPEVYKPFYSSKGRDHAGLGLTTAAVLAGQMKMRLGVASSPEVTTAWLSAPIAH